LATRRSPLSSEGQPDVQTKFAVVADAPGLFAQVVDGSPSPWRTMRTFIGDGGFAARVGEVVTVYEPASATSVPRPIGMAFRRRRSRSRRIR